MMTTLISDCPSHQGILDEGGSTESEEAREAGRKGGKARVSTKGFGTAEVRAKALATRATHRRADERENLRQAVIRAQAEKKLASLREVGPDFGGAK